MAEICHKPCKSCGVSYPADYYSLRQVRCKPCLNAVRKTHPSYNRDNIRRRNILYRYGISVEHAEQMLADQNGCCPICEVEMPPIIGYTANGKTCVIDHNALTGAVRGVLCNNCNLLLGHAKEDVNRLHKAIVYLAQRGTYHGPKDRTDEEAD